MKETKLPDQQFSHRGKGISRSPLTCVEMVLFQWNRHDKLNENRALENYEQCFNRSAEVEKFTSFPNFALKVERSGKKKAVKNIGRFMRSFIKRRNLSRKSPHKTLYI